MGSRQHVMLLSNNCQVPKLRLGRQQLQQTEHEMIGNDSQLFTPAPLDYLSGR